MMEQIMARSKQLKPINAQKAPSEENKAPAPKPEPKKEEPKEEEEDLSNLTPAQ